MRIRCFTNFFIQLDEDMELFHNSISIINESSPENVKDLKINYIFNTGADLETNIN